MIRRTTAIAAMTLALVSATAAPASAQPLFDIPTSILPHIVVPPPLYGGVVGFGGAANDFVLGFNANNDGLVRGLLGGVGGIFCTLSTISASPCNA